MSAPEPALAAWRSRIFLAAWVLYAGYYFCRKDLGAIASGDRTSVTHLAGSLICFGIMYAVGQLAGGAMADRYGARRSALAGAGISILCTGLLAWSSHPMPGLLLQLGNGFGQGFGWPSLLKLIAHWFRRGERDRILGWWSTSYILGGLLATSLTAWLLIHFEVSAGENFHPAYLVSSAVLLCAALFFYRTTSDLPIDPSIVPSIVVDDGAALAAGPTAGAWSTILGSHRLQIICGMYFFLKMTRYTLLFWLPNYLSSGLGYSTFAAAHTASYFELFGFLGPIAIGYIAQRWFAQQPMVLGAGMLFTLAFLCLLHPLLARGGPLGIAVSISLMGMLIHGADLFVSGMAVLDAVPAHMHGRAVGFVNSVGSAGQALSPLLITVFVSRLAWANLFDLFVFFAVVSGVICCFGAQVKPRNASQRTSA